MADPNPVLAGRVALVTGASRGIGRAIAQRLAAAGATVVVTARSLNGAAASQRFGNAQIVPGTLAETVALIEAAGGRAIPIDADLEKAEDRATLVERAVDAAGRIDILVNNAGFADYARIDAMSLETFDRTFEHYLRAPFALIRAAVPQMKAQGAGWIVNIGSVTALPPTRPYQDYAKAGGDTAYAAIKAALHRFSQGLAAELVDHDIAVNVVGPSTAIRTPGASQLIPDDFPTEDVEYLAETVLAMCHRPAAERTGLVAFSMHYPHHEGLTVRTLDGAGTMPAREPPAFSHPAIAPAGI
ncbi:MULTISPECIES: SDR family NAD(P)-dependent oxidoreductase [Sphingomonadales]|uniref:3-oxoacyl-[acyl-carrier-protein] reductase FabG n=1 Tax=Edaphosphingomonas haloaromaticamans TaxID=653954 RepID=A0A1S1HIF4_9SPHN|nr:MULTISPECIES: SDR family NAD(P)-dependent oxidoreductase [Sphingomonas]AGH48806.1 short-chain dehydrogenase/reductase SDR [Sphingomonas sp. MM-1]OHT21231.1 3-oxoacyl-[acyl-carrier-protein] reductase FabG [Sphingomonas haloaromaticamans]